VVGGVGGGYGELHMLVSIRQAVAAIGKFILDKKGMISGIRFDREDKADTRYKNIR
jgi:hypothetical protein